MKILTATPCSRRSSAASDQALIPKAGWVKPVNGIFEIVLGLSKGGKGWNKWLFLTISVIAPCNAPVSSCMGTLQIFEDGAVKALFSWCSGPSIGLFRKSEKNDEDPQQPQVAAQSPPRQSAGPSQGPRLHYQQDTASL